MKEGKKENSRSDIDELEINLVFRPLVIEDLVDERFDEEGVGAATLPTTDTATVQWEGEGREERRRGEDEGDGRAHHHPKRELSSLFGEDGALRCGLDVDGEAC